VASSYGNGRTNHDTGYSNSSTGSRTAELLRYLLDCKRVGCCNEGIRIRGGQVMAWPLAVVLCVCAMGYFVYKIVGTLVNFKDKDKE